MQQERAARERELDYQPRKVYSHLFRQLFVFSLHTVIACLFLGFHATLVSESMKEKTVRETEIQTIQRKVRILNTVRHGTHFKRIHVVFLLQNVFVLFFSSRTSWGEKQIIKQSKRR